MSVRWVGAQRFVLGGDIARVIDGGIRLEDSADHAACFLVYDHVETWHEAVEPRPIDDEAGLTDAVLRAARGRDVAVDQPVIFRLRAAAATATFHVLDKRDGLPHTPERHEQAKVHFQIDGGAVEVLGFYSTRHRGVFTPKERADGRRSRVGPRGTDHRRAGGRHRGAAEGDTMKLGAC